MHKDYSAYIHFLAAEYNILYLGKENQELYEKIALYFRTANEIDLNETILTKLSTILNKYDINLVVIDAQGKEDLANRFFQQIKEHDSEILTILLFDPKKFEKLEQTISFVDMIVFYPIVEQLFYKRLFSVLSSEYAIRSIGKREVVLKQKIVKEDSIDKLFDTYEGSSLFISDELSDMVAQINAGEFTKELFEEVAKKLDEIASIFSKSPETASVTHIYQELSSYLRKIKLEDIQPQQLKAFDYLSEILNDVSVYLLNMFVDRVFKDVYLFEHSLENNIIFFKSSLEGKEDDEDNSKLDFF